MLALKDVAAGGSQVGDEKAAAEAAVARCLLLLRIVHQVFLSHCPTLVAENASVDTDVSVSNSKSEAWEKSFPLRMTLVEMTLMPLLEALATHLTYLTQLTVGDATDGSLEEETYNYATAEAVMEEVKEMMESWNRHNVFGGPTVWEQYKKGWSQALTKASEEICKKRGLYSAVDYDDAEELAGDNSSENDTAVADVVHDAKVEPISSQKRGVASSTTQQGIIENEVETNITDSFVDENVNDAHKKRHQQKEKEESTTITKDAFSTATTTATTAAASKLNVTCSSDSNKDADDGDSATGSVAVNAASSATDGAIFSASFSMKDSGAYDGVNNEAEIDFEVSFLICLRFCCLSTEKKLCRIE